MKTKKSVDVAFETLFNSELVYTFEFFNFYELSRNEHIIFNENYIKFTFQDFPKKSCLQNKTIRTHYILYVSKKPMDTERSLLSIFMKKPNCQTTDESMLKIFFSSSSNLISFF